MERDRDLLKGERQGRLASGPPRPLRLSSPRRLEALAGDGELHLRRAPARAQRLEQLAFAGLQAPVMPGPHQQAHPMPRRRGLHEQLEQIRLAVHHRQDPGVRHLLRDRHTVAIALDPTKALLLLDRTTDRYRSLLSLLPAKHVLLMADACYSGLFATRSIPAPDLRVDPLHLTRGRLRQVLTAGERDQRVEEEGGHGRPSGFPALGGRLRGE